MVQKMEKLKSVCLQYAAATQWLISSSIDINSQSHPQKTMIRDTTVTESIL